MCLYPKLIINKKYTSTQKNKGIIPKCDDERKRLVPVGCGVCIECMKKRKIAWQVRLTEEIKHDKSAKFITLTFSEDNLEKLIKEAESEDAYIIAKIATRRFLERWRKKYKKSVKHWIISELGHEGTERLHMHGLLFTEKTEEEIEDRWGYGRIHIGEYVNERTINYITKYIVKLDKDREGYRPVIMTSPGMGRGYLKTGDAEKNKFRGNDTREYYRLDSGKKVGLPMYYRNAIYTEEERGNLWTQILDKNERYVMGEKIDVSDEKGEAEYYKSLEYYREKNRKLGYGSDTWVKENYKARRKLLKNLENK